MLTGFSPRSILEAFSHMVRCIRRKLPVVMPPRWGEKTTRSRQDVGRVTSGLSAVTGSGDTVSRPAAGDQALDQSGPERVVIHQIPPGGVDQECASFHMA